MQAPIDPKTLAGKTISNVFAEESCGIAVLFTDGTAVSFDPWDDCETRVFEPDDRQLFKLGVTDGTEYAKMKADEEARHKAYVEEIDRRQAEAVKRRIAEQK